MDSATEISRLVAADKVQGARIYSTAGDNLGSIDDVMIDEKSGNIAYAILSFGGFLGIGTRYHHLPWSMLRHDSNLGGYVVDLGRRQLKDVPACGHWL